MISTTHTLLSLAVLSKRGDVKRNWATAIGSFLPDAVIYIWAPYQSLVNKVDGRTLWNELYFQPPMQNLIAYFNSIPIYAVLAATGFILRGKIWGKLLMVFALAALLHMATDLPVHNHDAYRHFWPLSDWRFISPFSYYEAAHHSRWVSLIEAMIAFGSIAVLWKRFPKLWARIILIAMAVFYIFIQTQSLIR
ncbi:MAG: hypothetical protein ABJG88_11440 [Litorimonas sp.]